MPARSCFHPGCDTESSPINAKLFPPRLCRNNEKTDRIELKRLKMNLSRKHPNAGIRCPGHNYRSRCIYHIVLNKADEFPVFSAVVGLPDNHQWVPKTELSDVGKIIFEAISNIKSNFPYTSILRRCIMPDHVHLAIFIKEETDIHLGKIISSIKKECSDRYEAMGNPPGVNFFIPNYHDTFLTGKNQLQKMLAYISDNPRRHLVRKSNPGWFRQFIICSPDGKSRYYAYGNWDLLSEFQRVPVKVSRKYSPDELRRWKNFGTPPSLTTECSYLHSLILMKRK